MQVSIDEQHLQVSKNEQHSCDLKCVWMVAGLVSYRLCDQNFHCERCDFDRVMRCSSPDEVHCFQEHSVPALPGQSPLHLKRIDGMRKLTNQYLTALLSKCQIYLDRCYHPSQLWTLAETPNRVMVGIDNFILNVLSPINRIILPELKQFYREGQLITLIVRQNKSFPIYSPVSGRVTEINPEAAENQEQKLADRWLFKFEGEKLQEKIQATCGYMQSLDNYIRKIVLLKKVLFESFQENLPANYVTTIGDGGKIESNLELVLGQEKFDKMVKMFFQKR